MALAEEVKAEVRDRVEAGDFVQRLAERIGVIAQASAVFGAPIERAGVTVIPVAKATWGFGGGGGVKGGEQGAGGGGGGFVSPLGYIEVREHGAEFKPIRDPRVTALALGVGIGLAALAVRALARR
jgi:uncharacterized spore protein YtfJ